MMNAPDSASKDSQQFLNNSTPTLSRKLPPVNVVITASDTLPTTAPPVHPAFSVTIPSQHRLGVTPPASNISQDAITPHSYQISMPLQANIPTTVILPPLPASMTVSSPITKTNGINSQQNLCRLSEKTFT